MDYLQSQGVAQQESEKAGWPQTDWSHWQQSGVVAEGSTTPWQQAQLEDGIGEDPERACAQHLPGGNQTAPVSAPGSSGDMDAATPPPLPEGPPPLPPPEEAMPPLPAEDTHSFDAPLPPFEPEHPSASDMQSGAWTTTMREQQPASNPHDPHSQAQVNTLPEGWQSTYYQQPGGAQAPLEGGQDAAVHELHAESAANAQWQADPDLYAASYAQHQQYYVPSQQYQEYHPHQHYQQQQYPVCHQQQQQQQYWQQPHGAPWQYSAGQYNAPSSLSNPYTYAPPDMLQPTAPSYPAYHANDVRQPGTDSYSTATAYQPLSAAADAGTTTAAAGLSGPSQTPIVVVQAADLFEMPGCAKRPKKVCTQTTTTGCWTFVWSCCACSLVR